MHTDVTSDPDVVEIRRYSVPERWLVHAYYTVSPYGHEDRVLVAGADLDGRTSEILVLSSESEVLDRFGTAPLEGPTFFHTGRWQSWSEDREHVFYSAGTMEHPVIVRRHIDSGVEDRVDGALDGVPAPDGRVLAGLLGLLEFAKDPDRDAVRRHPIPFRDRHRHGLFQHSLVPPTARLRMSVADILDRHPQRALLEGWDRAIASRLGAGEGLTLLAFCVRWSPDGSRFLFFLGNNGTPPDREEPRVKYVMTMTEDLDDLHVAIDLGLHGRGVHWFWQPDGEHLIGYGPDPDDPSKLCLSEVRYDGTGYRKIAAHRSGGHPTVSPTDPDLIVTDHYPPDGRVCFIRRSDGSMTASHPLPLSHAGFPPGRSAQRIDAHPVFHPRGDRVLCNNLPGRHAELTELAVPTTREEG